jgi:hypothetical protein
VGDNKVYFRRNRGKRMRRKKRRKNDYVSFKTRLLAQPLVGRNEEPGRATLSST